LAAFTSEQIRNVAFVAHAGAGKTSLADAMFFVSGGTNRQGRVNDKTSLSDSEPEEQSRGSSIQTTVLPCEWKGVKINVLDTPGYADFRGEMLSGLRVADAAIIVVSASSGVEVGATQAWEMCQERNLPRLIVVNKLDRENTSFEKTVDEITSRWGRACIPVQAVNGADTSFTGVASLALPDDPEGAPGGWHERLIEAVAEADDDLTMKYLEGEALTAEELTKGLKAAVTSGSVFPILASSTETNAGIPELMDAVRDLLPSPVDAAGAGKDVPAGAQANFVFKTSADPFVGKLSYFRVYGAPLKKDSQLWNAEEEEAERVGQIFTPSGKEQTPVGEVVTGDIGVVPKLSVTRTFQTLGDRANPVTLPGIDVPEPVFSLAATPATAADLDKMASALSRVEEEDPTMRIDRIPETGETVIRGLGEVHVAMAIERVRRKFGVNLSTALPKIPYRETVAGTARSEYRHKKQTGGHGQYGHVIMQIAPGERGSGCVFTSKVVGGNVPREYIPAVEKGVVKAIGEGAVAGYPIVDVDVTLLDGSSHSVDSSGMSFEIAGGFALRNGVRDATPVLLEPVMQVSILVPDETTGDVLGDLNSRRGRILGMNPKGQGTTLIEADVPMASMQRYPADLRALTQSRGSFTAQFGHYDILPPDEQDRVVKQAAGREAASA